MTNKILCTHDADTGTTVYKYGSVRDRFHAGASWIQSRITSPVSMPLTTALDKNIEGFIFHQIGTRQGPEWWTGFNLAQYMPGYKHNTVIDKLPEKLREKLRQHTAMVHFDQSMEANPFVDRWFNYYEAFHNEFAKHNLPAEQFVITTCNLIENKLYAKWCSDNQIASRMLIVEANFFASACAQDQFFLPGPSSISFADHIEHKTNNNIQLFNCLNRVVREHRVAFVAMLNYYELIDDNKVSHDFFPEHFRNEIIINEFSRHPAFNYLNVVNTTQKLPLVLDTSHFQLNKAQHLFAEVYLDTWISVITETYYYEYLGTVIFFSEKIFKPMRAMHPFILVGTPGSIKELHTQGFKTFSDWWDESYDDIVEPTARLEAICNLLVTLSYKTKDEWMNMYSEIESVLVHNYNHLKTNDWLQALKPNIIDKIQHD